MSAETLIMFDASARCDERDGADRLRVGDHCTIYRTSASRRWYLQFSVDGRQFRHSLKTDSKKRALDLAKKKDAELTLKLSGAPVKKPATITEARETYLATMRGRGKDARTLLIYGRDLLQFDAWCRSTGVRRLDGASDDVLEEFQRQLQTTGLPLPSTESDQVVKKDKRRRARMGKPCKATTVRGKMKSVRQLIRFALKRGLIEKDPAPSYQLPGGQKDHGYCWDPPTLRAILEHADKCVVDLLRFLLMTGLRSDELCHLTKEDLDVVNPHVKIRAKICPDSGKRWRPKHGNERNVPLCAEALAIAQTALGASPGRWLFLGARHHQTHGSMEGRQNLERGEGRNEGGRRDARHDAHVSALLLFLSGKRRGAGVSSHEANGPLEYGHRANVLPHQRSRVAELGGRVSFQPILTSASAAEGGHQN